MTWLLTGGAGYIGAHVARSLLDSGRGVVVLDDLSTGLERKVPDGVPLVRASVGDADAVRAVLHDHAIEGVVHLAAKKAVGESVAQPLYYYRENVGGLITLLEAMRDTGVRRLVYSSSAAVYGTPGVVPIPETSTTVPDSPYGETKLAGEWLVRDAATEFGLAWASLRYFNVAGAGSVGLGDTGVNNLIPMVFRALSTGERPRVFGTDYPTPDGSCVRDYIHAQDLAEAHVAAAAYCEGGASGVFNVGRGEGFSVLEVMDVISDVVGYDVNALHVERRPGDPATLVAAADRIADVLGWRATRDLRQMVESAWDAWQAWPVGQ